MIKANYRKIFVCFCVVAIIVGTFTVNKSIAQDSESNRTIVKKLKWWKGNLHTHSLWSDGDDFPEMIAKWYRDHDYSFLALTDHNILSIGEKWIDRQTIIDRGGETILQKYVQAWGNDWVDARTNDDGTAQVRLKALDEFRSKLEQPEQFLLIQAEEISDKAAGVPVHMNATNLSSVIQPVGGATVAEAINNNLRVAQDQAQQTGTPILVHLNHPNYGWAVTAEDLAAVTNERFLEVYNGHPGVNHLGDATRPSVERMWDIANTLRISQISAAPMYGLANDDCHYYHGRAGSQPGRGWIMVRCQNLATDKLITAIHQGEFYCSSGVTLDDVQFDLKQGRLSLVIESNNEETFTTQFIGTRKDFERASSPRLAADGKPIKATRVYSKDIGQVLATDHSLTPSYVLTGDELYVRAVVTSSADHPNPSFENQKQQAWTQPVGWQK